MNSKKETVVGSRAVPKIIRQHQTCHFSCAQQVDARVSVQAILPGSLEVGEALGARGCAPLMSCSRVSFLKWP